MSDLKIACTNYGYGMDFEKSFNQRIDFFGYGNKVKDYDLIIFPGGSDVTPKLYGEKNTHSGCNYPRDMFELKLLEEAITLNKKIIGICRGNQFINAMLGGKLNQDLDIKHKMEHEITIVKSHPVIDFYKDKLVTSTHHQAVLIPGIRFEVLAIHKQNGTIEATKCGNNILTMQFHPEYQDVPEFFNSIKEWCKYV